MHVLTFDYLGALGASLLFPIYLVPKLGLVRSAIAFGLVNAGVALWSTYLFEGARRQRAAWARPAFGTVQCVVACIGNGCYPARCTVPKGLRRPDSWLNPDWADVNQFAT